MKHLWIKSTLALAIATTCGYAAANGLSLNEQSVSGMGTAYAGRASTAQDATVIFGNPAGMSKLHRTEVSGGLTLISAQSKISHGHTGTSYPVAGKNKGDMVPTAVVPFGYLVTPLNDDWHFGLGVYSPFGVISDYSKSFMGRYKALLSKVEVITVQPTLSYKINDRLAVGFGPTINRVSGVLSRNIFLGQNVPDAKAKVTGDDTSLGYNLGVMVDLSEKTTMGLTYHSKVKYTLKGHTKIENFRTPDLANFKFNAKLNFTTPESVDASITHKLDDRWTLYGGATWTRWSHLNEIAIQNKNVPSGLANRFDTITEETRWKDVWAFAVGASYQLNPQWIVRAGIASDASPTTNSRRTTRIPVSDRKILSLGAGWEVDDNLSFDFAYAYLHERKGEVNQAGDPIAPGVSSPGYFATFRNSANLFSAQMNYRF